MKRLLPCLAAGLLAIAAHAAEDVPFVVTPDNVTVAMLQLAGVHQDDYLIDLGSGDGRIVITAARRFGARGMGIEIDPRLIELSRDNARKAGVSGRAFFREQDLFKTDLAPASVITMYLLPEVNLQLRPKLLALRPGTRIVSHDWDMGEWQPDKAITLEVPDKPIGREKSSKVFLWVVPARVQGLWCGTGKHKGATLQLAQEFQRFRGQFERSDARLDFEGRIDGEALRARKVVLRLEGEKLRVQAIDKSYSTYHRGTFARARGQICR